ncbi:aldo/keto reductase [Streptomyces xiaopingdaonensis]|uniref:aldo/keto reductase n=1 Tax=Streptomyces xiaopingdaonensis TaxID=1565415 RepID=UPI0002D53279|nr:aldo/keto reductase [Streptomyces xiaopingdaonensis]
MTSVPALTLNNGTKMPQLGFGVYQVPDDEAATAVGKALELGYRSIDTAALYGNEEGTGRAVAASGIPREELFVTTKLWNTDQGYDTALRAFDTSLANLGLDYVDLYLIHWPAPAIDAYVETWRAFEEILRQGRAKAIGVSNFQIQHLRRLLEETDTVPAVNQIELHPRLQQGALRAFHAEHGIATEAWSPLGRNNGVLDDPLVHRIAESHGKTPAQTVLRWQIELGNVAIPKSVTPSRMAENLDVLDFRLDDSEVQALTALETGERVGPDPDTLN